MSSPSSSPSSSLPTTTTTTVPVRWACQSKARYHPREQSRKEKEKSARERKSKLDSNRPTSPFSACWSCCDAQMSCKTKRDEKRKKINDLLTNVCGASECRRQGARDVLFPSLHSLCCDMRFRPSANFDAMVIIFIVFIYVVVLQMIFSYHQQHRP